tara:strand:+ start:181 stop:960 length:780 start_codon:yes stop_codon:yes gene_type:complete
MSSGAELILELDWTQFNESSTRINCMMCGGHKTLSISKKDGKLLWQCFKAKCSMRGAKRVGRSSTEIRQKLHSPSAKNKKLRLELPEITSDPRHHPKALRYLIKNNCLHAYSKRLLMIRYAPQFERVLFYTQNQNGAVGRFLLNSAKPKWKAFGQFDSLLSVGTSSTAVLVEDAASACAVSATEQLTGVALLGTNLSNQQRLELMGYKKLVIALDKDASRKALKLHEALRGAIDTKLIFLQRDFKYLKANEILERVNEG